MHPVFTVLACLCSTEDPPIVAKTYYFFNQIMADLQSPSQPGKRPAETRTVTEVESGQRLDNYLVRHLKGVPRTHIYRIVRDGQVRLNGGRVRPSVRVSEGDRVRVPPLRRDVSQNAGVGRGNSDFRASILFEDSNLLVIDKPPGIAVHGGSGLRGGVIEFLRSRSEQYLELVHRLDKETSGILVLAKDMATLRSMHEALRQNVSQNRIRKSYQVLLVGQWRGGRRTLSHRLQTVRRPGGVKRSQVDTRGREAYSVFDPLERYSEHTLMRVGIKTGRLHQVRAHAQAIGLPVAGDRVYGDSDQNRALRKLGLHRQFLHADRLRFTHPVTGRKVDIQAPLPEDLAGVLACLETSRRES